jgi:hypothetical protein
MVLHGSSANKALVVAGLQMEEGTYPGGDLAEGHIVTGRHPR